ncbi:MAG: class I SAM-dependent methyltransferase [Gemmatimonadetes bacterium]|nr:class I SAM-dependent methyltransferase [Gemmatimonadota bacterium]
MLAHVEDAYEALYTGRSYQHEIGLVDRLLDVRLPPPPEDEEPEPRRVLEIGCGPGLRLAVLNQWHGKYRPEGLDRDPEMLRLAARRLGDVPLHLGDMRDFTVDGKFAAVLCLFGMIGYMRDVADMTKAVTRMRSHLAPNGVLLLEPWLSPAQVTDGHVKIDRAVRPGLFVQRMNYTRIVGNRSLLDIHYLIGTDSGVRHVQELRTLTLFTDAEYRTALKAAGFGDVVLEAYGPQGRGLYIAQV